MAPTCDRFPAWGQVERIEAHDFERPSAAGIPVSSRLAAGFKRKIALAPFPLPQSAFCLIRRIIAVAFVKLAFLPTPSGRQAGHCAQARQRRRLPGGTRRHGRLRHLRAEWLGLFGVHNQMPPAFNVIKITIVARASTLWQKTAAQFPAWGQVERIEAHDSEKLSSEGDPGSISLVAGFKRKIPLAPFPDLWADVGQQRKNNSWLLQLRTSE